MFYLHCPKISQRWARTFGVTWYNKCKEKSCMMLFVLKMWYMNCFDKCCQVLWFSFSVWRPCQQFTATTRLFACFNADADVKVWFSAHSILRTYLCDDDGSNKATLLIIFYLVWKLSSKNISLYGKIWPHKHGMLIFWKSL